MLLKDFGKRKLVNPNVWPVFAMYEYKGHSYCFTEKETGIIANVGFTLKLQHKDML